MNADQYKNVTMRIVIRLFLLSFTSICLMMSGCITPKPMKKTTSNVRYVATPFHDRAENQS
jgi:hypothetical protein